MKILVLSDSHSALSLMRLFITRVRPDAVIHLGDHYDDGGAMAEEFSHIRFYRVPGNCDKYRCDFFVPETLVETVCGVKLFMTHGHIHRVKSGLGALIRDGNATGAQAVVFGHTHSPHCTQEENGMWVLNPGSCGYFGGSAAIIEVADHKITDCRIITESELEDLV